MFAIIRESRDCLINSYTLKLRTHFPCPSRGIYGGGVSFSPVSTSYLGSSEFSEFWASWNLEPQISREENTNKTYVRTPPQ